MKWEKVTIPENVLPEFPLDILSQNVDRHKIIYFDGYIKLHISNFVFFTFPVFSQINNIEEVKNKMIYLAGQENIPIKNGSLIHIYQGNKQGLGILG